MIGCRAAEAGHPASSRATGSLPGSGEASSTGHEDQSWGPLTVLPVVDPRDHGAGGTGRTDDTEALQATVDTLSDTGGIVWFEKGTTYHTSDVVRVTSDHVKLWAPNGQSEIVAVSDGRERRQALIVDGADNVGLFGLRLRSDADRRLAALEDSSVVVDDARRTELIGLEITNSASAAIIVFGRSRDTFVDGNSIHHTWSDSVHFTDGAHHAWVWKNQFFTDESRPGDDGVACVTYGSGPVCRDMEWWDNLHMGSGWGRGLAVVGGEDISIHHNTVRRTGAAGILVASESSYDTPGSHRIAIHDNVVIEAGQAVSHPGILVSGLAGPITAVTIENNVVVTTDGGEAVRVEGDVQDLRESATSTYSTEVGEFDSEHEFGSRVKETTVLATRDPTLVDSRFRAGLYRVHLRREPRGQAFQQRFEYVVAGRRPAVEKATQDTPGVSALFEHTGSGDAADVEQVLVLRTAEPIEIGEGLRSVGFEDLRSLSSQLPDLWSYVDAI